MSSFVVCHVADSDVAPLWDVPGAHLQAVGGDKALLHRSCSFGACCTCCGWCPCYALWLVVAIGDGGEQGWWALWTMVVVEKEWSCLLMTPKLSIGKH